MNMVSDSDSPVQVLLGYCMPGAANPKQGCEKPLGEEDRRPKCWYFKRMLRYEVLDDEFHNLDRQQRAIHYRYP